VFNLQSRGSLKAVLLSGAAIAAAYSIAAPAFADEAVETVVVTGSRIQTTNLTSPSPVSVSTAEQIQLTKATNLEDVLLKMTGPDLAGGLSVNSNNGGVGLSLIGLRTLGPTRTLVLIDGQRDIPEFVGTISVPDFNAIPVPMVERIEVLRDGASSVYGADAIGGVINIITKKDFSGLQLDVNGGDSQHGGGATYGLSATMGANVDRGNVTINLEHDFDGGIQGYQRDWATDTHATDPNFPGGSVYRSQLATLQQAGSNTMWIGGTPYSTKNSAAPSVPCDVFVSGLGKWRLDADCRPPGGGAWNALTSQLERSQISINGHYDVTNNVTFIMQGSFTDRRTGQQLRPEPLLGSQIATTSDAGTTIFPGFLVPANVHWGYTSGGSLSACPAPNAGQSCLNANFTPSQFGPRTYRQNSETYRMKAGFEGHLWGDYNWEAGYVQQRNDDTNQTFNTGNFFHLAQELGEIPCIDAPGGCTAGPAFGYAWSVPNTPVNWFDGPTPMTKAQRDYLVYDQVDTNHSWENYFYADFGGPVIDDWAGTIRGSIGVERRWEHAEDHPDILVQDGFGPNKSAPTFGGYGVWSAYGELAIPVLKDMPFAKSLEVRPSARWDNYSNFGSATTWKVGADWDIVDDVRVRGTYSTNFRAPSVAELFGGNAVSYLTVHGDPCDSRTVINGNTNMPATAAEATARLAGSGGVGTPGNTTCYNALAALGLTAAAIHTYQSPENNLSSDQRGFLIGGNPTLKPEKAHQWTLGVVLTPHWVPGLSFGADYYNITITNTVIGGVALSFPTPNTFLLDCYSSATQNAGFCTNVQRTLGSGIQQILSTNANFGVAKVSGLDMEATYANEWDSLGIGLPGSFTLNVQASNQYTNSQTEPDGSTSFFLGTTNPGNEAIFPKWRGTLNFDWTFGGWALHYDAQFIGHASDSGPGGGDPFGAELPDYVYHNISAGYELGGLLKDEGVIVSNTRIIVGINNLFDKDPPFYGSDSICKCNSFAGTYDFAGRFFYTRLSTKL
jgi:outer membrane receptor protein involved in Fe transport